MTDKYTLPRGYLSASQISLYLGCSMQYYYRYVEQVPSPPNIAMMTGSACHHGFELYYQNAIDKGGASTLKGKEVSELAVVSIEEEAFEKNIQFDGPEKDHVVSEIQVATCSYIDTIAPKVTPIAVEKEIKFEVLPGLEVLGYIDLIRQKADSTEDVVVCDYKITKNKWSLSKLTNSIQFLLYAIGTAVADIEIHNLRKTTGTVVRKPGFADAAAWNEPTQDVTNNIRILRNSFSDRTEHNHVLNLVEHVATGITKGIFFPCDPDSWRCTRKWCNYWHLCRGKST